MTYHGQMAGICWDSHRPETTASGHLMIHLQKVKTMMAPDRFRPRTRGRHLPTYLSIYNTTIEPLSDHVVPHPPPLPPFVSFALLSLSPPPQLYYLYAHLNPSAPPSAPYPNAKSSKPSNHPSRKPFSLNTLLPTPSQPAKQPCKMLRTASPPAKHLHPPHSTTPPPRQPSSHIPHGKEAISPSSPPSPPPPSSTLPPSLKPPTPCPNPKSPTTIPQSRQATSTSHRARARASSFPSPSQGVKGWAFKLQDA